MAVVIQNGPVCIEIDVAKPLTAKIMKRIECQIRLQSEKSDSVRILLQATLAALDHVGNIEFFSDLHKDWRACASPRWEFGTYYRVGVNAAMQKVFNNGDITTRKAIGAYRANMDTVPSGMVLQAMSSTGHWIDIIEPAWDMTQYRLITAHLANLYDKTNEETRTAIDMYLLGLTSGKRLECRYANTGNWQPAPSTPIWSADYYRVVDDDLVDITEHLRLFDGYMYERKVSIDALRSYSRGLDRTQALYYRNKTTDTWTKVDRPRTVTVGGFYKIGEA